MWRRSFVRIPGLMNPVGYSNLSSVISNSNTVGLGFRRWMSSETGKRFAALWGNGDFGRLGLRSLESKWLPTVCSALRDHSLKDVACGGAHTLFLTETGRVFATGLNDWGQLGVSDVNSYTMGPVEVTGLDDVLQISAGYNHSAAVTVNGELYMWGKNSSGQLGLGKKAPKTVHLPTKVDFLCGITIKLVALGSEHSVAVSDESKVFSWGGGASGRLGHGQESGFFGAFRSSSEFTPRLIKNFEGLKVKKIAAGLMQTACIDENGSVFIFGERALDKLGLRGSNNAATPSMISTVPYIDEVACGGYHTCVLTRTGELYTWGSNENGCLGTGSIDVSHSPEKIEGPFLTSSVSKVSCGWKHTAAVADGNVFTWGWGGSNGTFSVDGHSSGGQLGHGTDVDYITPRKVDLGEEHVKALQVSCGFNHTAALLEHI